MKISKVTPKCEECLKHDEETKRLVQKLFSADELRVLTLIVANTLQHAANNLAALPEADMSRLRLQSDLDFLSCTMGKLYVGLAEAKPLLHLQLKRMGIDLKIQHEECPHANVHQINPKEAQP